MYMEKENLILLQNPILYRITNRRIQIEQNIQRVTKQHINSRVNYQCCSVTSYLSIFEFFN